MQIPTLHLETNKKNGLLSYFLISSIGLIGLIYSIAYKIGSRIFTTSQVLNEWANYFNYPEKRLLLLAYVLGVLGLFAYYILIVLLLKFIESRNLLEKIFSLDSRVLLLIFLLNLAVNIAMIFIPLTSLFRLVIALFAWMLLFLLPGIRLVGIDRVQSKAINKYFVWIVAIVIIQFFSVFYPLVNGDLRMMNEYLEIPEQTLINNEYVDNATFLNKTGLFTLQKYDAASRMGRNSEALTGSFAHMKKSAELDKFIEANKVKYFYDQEINALRMSNASMTDEERITLLEIARDENERKQVNELYSARKLYNKELKEKEYTAAETEFLNKNLFEFIWQIQNRWVVHHHNFVLGPINELALGRDIKDINMQYGLLNIVVMKFLLEHFGGVNYQNYFVLWNSFYYIYYLIFLAVTFFLFRKRIGYMLLTLLLTAGILNKIGFQFLFLGPGLNPIRHFFDIIVLLMLYLYEVKRKPPYFIGGIVFSLIGVMNNTQLGFFACAAYIVTIIIKLFLEGKKPKWFEWFLLFITPAVVVYMMLFMDLGKDKMVGYYLNGLLGFPISKIIIFIIMFLFSVGYIILVKFSKIDHPLKFVSVFLLLYSQGIMLYYIWGATDVHFLNLAPIYALTFIVILKLFVDNSTFTKHQHSIVVVCLIPCLLFYAGGMYNYYKQKNQYDAVFADHKVYEWNFERAKFTSTMDPKYFENSVALIEKYAPNENGIYMISRFDNFIPFLSNKYSNMPYPDTAWFLNTGKEVNDSIHSILENKPEFIFVDTDIERNRQTEIVNEGAIEVGRMSKESELRVLRLDELKKVFLGVKEQYQLVEKSELISVYKKIK
jgi:hypothetical protein